MMLVDFFLAQLYGIVPEQKAMQLDEESHFLLHDIACLWIYLRPKMAATFPGEVVKRHEDLFHKGCCGRMYLGKSSTNTIKFI